MFVISVVMLIKDGHLIGNIKDYYLSYYCVINLNIYNFKVSYCSKNQLKIFKNTLQRFFVKILHKVFSVLVFWVYSGIGKH